jgi:hypothetical protein
MLEDRLVSEAAAERGDPTTRVPTIDGLLRPVLEVLSDGETHEMTELVSAVSDHLGLDSTTQSVRTASGGDHDRKPNWVGSYEPRQGRAHRAA